MSRLADSRRFSAQGVWWGRGAKAERSLAFSVCAAMRPQLPTKRPGTYTHAALLAGLTTHDIRPRSFPTFPDPESEVAKFS